MRCERLQAERRWMGDSLCGTRTGQRASGGSVERSGVQRSLPDTTVPCSGRAVVYFNSPTARTQ